MLKPLRYGALILCLWPALAWAEATLTVIHPEEGQALPDIKEVFVYGEVTPGSTLTINGAMIKVHPKGGYLVMLPVQSGNVLLSCEATTPKGEKVKVDRHFTVAPGFVESPVKPLTLVKDSIEPSEDLVLAPGDPLRVTFQGSPQSNAEFTVQNLVRHVPVLERLGTSNSTETAHGLYEGTYIIQPGNVAKQANIDVQFKSHGQILHATAKGHLTIDPGEVPRVGMIVDDVVALRTGPEGGYDLFLYRGMRVRLTGKVKNEWRVKLSNNQSGWIKESSIQELPLGTPAPRGVVSNMVVTHLDDSTQIKIPMESVLPYRTEQLLNPTQLILTIYGAIDKTDLIKYDPLDTVIRQVRWKQIGPDTCQIIIEPQFKAWWGYDVHYEGSTLVVEVRKPWGRKDLKGMIIALDPGHGGPELGATGPHGTLEKDCNLAIARVVRNVLETAGAHVIMTRDGDMLVPLYERPKIAWSERARLFISIHANASGEGDDPLINNGYSVYSYQPQSIALAQAVHAQYGLHLHIPDRGLYFSDFAVCRMTQMPAILTENAYLIVPEQELMLFNPEFQQSIAQAILAGIKNYLAAVY
jgi:N-acetylmuramoyl-L-alanine amidase